MNPNGVSIARVQNGYIVTLSGDGIKGPPPDDVQPLGPMAFLARLNQHKEPQVFVAKTWDEAVEISRKWVTAADVPDAFKGLD